MAARNHRQNRERRNKRHDDKYEEHQKNCDIDESSDITKAFREFQKELDLKNDRHERIVKLSRDITIESKRLIFLLHRAIGSDKKNEILNDAENKLEEIHRTKYLPLATELSGQDSFQFLKAFSPGLQEYIEAVTFYHYLKDQELVGAERIQTDLTFSDVCNQPDSSELALAAPPSACESDEQSVSSESQMEHKKTLVVPIPLTEYMLGLADFTGELMRLAINSVGAGDLDTPKQVTDLMRVIHNAFASFNNAPRELRRKATVLRQSLQKVENACYNLRVRGSEIPKHMLADVFTTTHSSHLDDNFGEAEEIM